MEKNTAPQPPLKLSAYVLTHNSGQFLENCLKSLDWVDELVIVDDESTDQTRSIAERYGAKIFSRKLDNFSAQRNFALENCVFEWVLQLDADEEISAGLKEEIIQLQKKPVNVLAFMVPRKNFFSGIWLRNTYPDYGIRLFYRRDALYTGLVHENLQIPGKIGYLKAPIIHYPYTNLDDFIAKMNRYTSIHAKEIYQKGKRANISDITLRPFFKFIKYYFFKGGFRDGIPGFIISISLTYYTFLKYAKLLLLARQEKLKNGK